jgi:hypothetical protein
MMSRLFFKAGVMVAGLLAGKPAMAQLEVRSDDKGISYLAYNKTELVNTARQVGLGFSAEAHKITEKSGKEQHYWSHLQSITRKSGQQNQWVYKYNFGDVTYSYRQQKDTLFLTLTVLNNNDAATLNGVNLIPLQLAFPVRPKGFQQYFPYYHYNLDGPTVVPADFGTGKVVLSNEDTRDPLFVGLLDVNAPAILYKVWVSAVPFNGMTTAGIPNIDEKLGPRQSITYQLALRFYAPGASDKAMAASGVMERYRQANKMKFTWNDRRPMGMLVLSSVSKQDAAANPRGFMPTEKVTIRTSAGLKQLRQQVMDYAKRSVDILKSMNAQGMITWDIEGQEFPHAISYVGSPDQLPKVAPEMETLADDYFALFRKAGFKTGICIRPQEFVLSKDGKSATQKDVKDPAAVLIRKIKYAKKRWGCTIFYIDSNVEPSTALMSASVFKTVHDAVPDVLLVPEHQDIRYYEYAAPYEEMRFGGRGPEAVIRASYPSAFQVITIGEGIFDGNGKQVVPEDVLKNMIRQGNVLLFRAWYQDQPTNNYVKQLYEKVQSEKK